jgi:ferredoxin
MIVYFTGTGNSRYCAQWLAHALGDEAMDSFRFIRDGIAAGLTSKEPWVFVAPTYGWQLSRIFADFIRSSSFTGSRDGYFVMTCGSDIGNAGAKIKPLCAQKELNYKGVLQVVMPENYIALFDVLGQEEAQEIISAARPTLESAAICIREGRDFSAPKVGVIDKLKSGIVNAAFYRFIIKAKPFTVSDACVSCGKCADVCPLGNVRLEEGKPIWDAWCTHCMACICVCPTSAIEYGKASRGKPRYQCPAYRETL